MEESRFLGRKKESEFKERWRGGMEGDIPVNVPNVLLLAVRSSRRDICAAAEAARAEVKNRVERCILPT